jgi:hypothetical protein
MVACFAAQARAVVITFTGGTVTRLDTSTQTTNNVALWNDVDYYEEGGFRLDFLPNAGSAGFASHVGVYYPPAAPPYHLPNDVIHSHWATGNFGGVTTVRITKNTPGTFDLNYFILTSNTEFGGGIASGNERAFVRGYNGGLPTGPAVLLPSQDWGFFTFPQVAQIFLGPDFNAVDRVDFYVENSVDCFGMDEFYIDQPAPGTVPEASSLIAWSLVIATGVAFGWRGRTVPSPQASVRNGPLLLLAESFDGKANSLGRP